MNKFIFSIFLALSFLLSACGSDESWEEESVEVSDRMLTDEVKVDWELEKDPNGTSGTLIRLAIKDGNGKPIEDFSINHEKLLHLIVASRDLSYFNHIHPDYKGKGIFEIVNEFPAGGEYRMVADFKPSEADAMSKIDWVAVEGPKAASKPLSIDKELRKTVDGQEVALSMDPQPQAEKPLTLKFSILDAKTSQPVTDLQPYLGSIGHVVIFSEDGERYLHVHALENQGNGPEALFETTFPKSGRYKIWGQFQRNNQVFTVSYVIDVP